MTGHIFQSFGISTRQALGPAMSKTLYGPARWGPSLREMITAAVYVAVLRVVVSTPTQSLSWLSLSIYETDPATMRVLNGYLMNHMTDNYRKGTDRIVRSVDKSLRDATPHDEKFKKVHNHNSYTFQIKNIIT
jgi:hypothetical protein